MKKRGRKRYWSVQKILQEFKRVLTECGDVTHSHLQKHHTALYRTIFKSNILSDDVKILEKSTGAQRYLWVLKQFGLTARKSKLVPPGNRTWRGAIRTWIVDKVEKEKS